MKVRRCCRSLELARRNRETDRSATTPRHRHHPPGIKNSKSDSYAEIDTDSLHTGLRTWCTSLTFTRETTPACPAYPGGLVVARCRSQRTADACRHRETVRAARTPWHRHHPPGIKNSKSKSYAEMRTDSLRYETADVMHEFGTSVCSTWI